MRLFELVSLARLKSPFYRELYAHLPSSLPTDETELRCLLPIVSSADFWAANTLKNNRLLTASMDDGIVFKSGGTTGAPKFSVFSKNEWSSFCHAFGRGLSAGGLQEGERVGNLFYAGELYASFLFIMKSFEAAGPRSLHVPIGGHASMESIIATVLDFEVTTLAGTPTLFIQLAESVAEKGIQLPGLKRLLFGGESLYEDQRARLQEVFPGARIQSIGYASVDAGLLGYADLSCGPEEHRVFGRETIYEILDEATGQVIDEVGVPGKAVITYLERELMPIIRYPVGDRAQWSEPKGVHADRRFRLLGRSEEAARVGPVSLFFDDVREVFHNAQQADSRFAVTGLQIITQHFDRKDELVIRLSPAHAGLEETDFLAVLLKARGMLQAEVARGNIHPPRVELVAFHELEKNPRTGKTKRVIDRRL